MKKRTGIVLATTALFLAGCDLGTYGKRYTERLPELVRRGEQKANLGTSIVPLRPSAGTDTGLVLTLPKAFDGAPEIGPEFGADRVNPPRLPLPGRIKTYEKYVQAPSGNRLPSYCYVCVIPAGEKDYDTVQKELLTKVTEIIDRTATWEAKEFVSLTGQPVKWHAMRALAAQPFFQLDAANKGANQSLDGQIAMYTYQAEGNTVLIAFRFPNEVVDAIGFPAAAEAALGTIAK